METFTVRDLRERTGKLIRSAQAGKLFIVTKHGSPVFVAVPFDEMMLKEGVGVALAIHLFGEGRISLSSAARMAGIPVSEMIDLLGRCGTPIIGAAADELDRSIRVSDVRRSVRHAKPAG